MDSFTYKTNAVVERKKLKKWTRRGKRSRTSPPRKPLKERNASITESEKGYPTDKHRKSSRLADDIEVDQSTPELRLSQREWRVKRNNKSRTPDYMFP